MKKLSYLLLSLVFVGSMSLFTGCTDDDEASTLNITVTELEGATYEPGTDVTYEVSVVTNKELESLTMEPSEGQVEDLTAAVTGMDSVVFNYIFTVPDVADGTNVTLTFNATDDSEAAATTTQSFTVVVVTETEMTDNQDGELNHILGPYQGAWDLVNNEGVSEGGTENRYLGDNKDMINRESPNAKDEFYHQFVAGNETRFVQANDFDYDNATVEAAMSTYEAASDVLGAAAGLDWDDHVYAEVAEGDIFVAKLRGGSDYAVIKINTVSGTNSDDGIIEFSYKKAPADAKKSADGKTYMVFY